MSIIENDAVYISKNLSIRRNYYNPNPDFFKSDEQEVQNKPCCSQHNSRWWRESGVVGATTPTQHFVVKSLDTTFLHKYITIKSNKIKSTVVSSITLLPRSRLELVAVNLLAPPAKVHHRHRV